MGVQCVFCFLASVVLILAAAVTLAEIKADDSAPLKVPPPADISDFNEEDFPLRNPFFGYPTGMTKMLCHGRWIWGWEAVVFGGFRPPPSSS